MRPSRISELAFPPSLDGCARRIEKILYEAAASLGEPSDRQAFLEQTCQEDPALRARLEQLLRVQADADAFFATDRAAEPKVRTAPILGGGAGSGLHDSETLEHLGTCIGRYRLLRRLGEGGCGVVYLAEQEEPVHRRVALKVIRLGLDSDYAIARFEIERQALALMDHPNIARVLDAGTTGSGRPFFVMELVVGKQITDFCDGLRLDLAGRLQLFIQVCFAIQHAHQKGIIHRDIKPANVMVSLHDGVPLPKVIDFGVAKATAGHLSARSVFTTVNRLIGTPSYMSPEQAEGSGLDVDTRSDVYSLGVLLFELLTGNLPHDTKSDWRSREGGPPLPSSLVAAMSAAEGKSVAEQRKCDPRRLVQMLSGDMDGIVIKAMEHDRQRRYGTANGLAMDLQRYLNSEPVSARLPGRGYRLRMLIRRNKMVFAFGAIAIVSLSAGLGTSTWLLIRERAATKEQVRLRDAAERARANEVNLRQQAEAGQRIARAAVNVQAGRLVEADQLVADIAAEQVPSTLEAAATFRRLGEWHVEGGRLRQAADRYEFLARAITTADRSDNSTISFELVAVAAVLSKLNDPERYEGFRRLMIDRFAGTAKAGVASHVVKVCLLRPPNEAMMAVLAPLVSSTEADLPKEGDGPPIQAWRMFSVALMRYREGDLTTAWHWASRCVTHPDKNASRRASAHLVLAMVAARSGESETARAELLEASEPIRRWLDSPYQPGNGYSGYWFDWMIASVLMDEALVEIDE